MEGTGKKWVLKEIYKQKKLRYFLSIDKDAKYFTKERQ